MKSFPLCEHKLVDDLLLRSRPAGVHRLYPTKLITSLEVFGDVFGLGELGGNEVDLFIGLVVDIDAGSRYIIDYCISPFGIGLSPVPGLE